MTQAMSRLMRVYARAVYRAFDAGAVIEFSIGRPSLALEALLARTGATTAMFITAYNSMSVPRPDPVNRAADRALRRALRLGGWACLAGEGADPAGRWRPEPSFLVLNIGAAAARTLARRFGQAAIVAIRRGNPPRLVRTSK
ncbi:MAG: DUF3293 domain-containing protein [Rhodospirillaceae bacterium]|nr:DUF3293 domain-containing protein [Rhodospirillaceae bacterium]